VRGSACTIFNEIMIAPLREERRLKVFENRVLRRIFGAKRDEVTRECRKMHNKLMGCTPHPLLFG